MLRYRQPHRQAGGGGGAGEETGGASRVPTWEGVSGLSPPVPLRGQNVPPCPHKPSETLGLRNEGKE